LFELLLLSIVLKALTNCS